MSTDNPAEALRELTGALKTWLDKCGEEAPEDDGCVRLRDALTQAEKVLAAAQPTPAAPPPTDAGLPELPPGDQACAFLGRAIVYDADQMRTYAAASVAAATAPLRAEIDGLRRSVQYWTDSCETAAKAIKAKDAEIERLTSVPPGMPDAETVTDMHWREAVLDQCAKRGLEWDDFDPGTTVESLLDCVHEAAVEPLQRELAQMRLLHKDAMEMFEREAARAKRLEALVDPLRVCVQALEASRWLAEFCPDDLRRMDGAAMAGQSVLDLIDAGAGQDGAREPSALDFARSLAVTLHAKHYSEVAQWRPLDDLYGLLTQISNMVAGLVRDAQPPAAPAQAGPSDKTLAALRACTEALAYWMKHAQIECPMEEHAKACLALSSSQDALAAASPASEGDGRG